MDETSTDLDQKIDENAEQGRDAEGHKLDEIDQPHIGNDTHRAEHPEPLGDTTGLDHKTVNETPGLEGGAHIDHGQPIPNTEGRTADRDDLKVQDIDTTDPGNDFIGNPSAQPQAPDPKVLSGRSYDVEPQEADREPKDLMQAAGEAVSDPGLQAQELDPENPGARPRGPHRPVTAPPSAMEPTRPVGSKPQPGAPDVTPPLGSEANPIEKIDTEMPEGYKDDGTGGVRYRVDHRGIKEPRVVEGRPRSGAAAKLEARKRASMKGTGHHDHEEELSTAGTGHHSE